MTRPTWADLGDGDVWRQRYFWYRGYETNGLWEPANVRGVKEYISVVTFGAEDSDPIDSFDGEWAPMVLP